MDNVYLINRKGVEIGKFTTAELKAALAAGTVLPDDLAWTPGMATWQKASTLTLIESDQVFHHVTPKNNRFAIAGMICGLSSLCLICCFFGFPMNVVAIISSMVALRQMKTDPNLYITSGRAFAIIGLITGVISFALLLIMLMMSATGELDHWI